MNNHTPTSSQYINHTMTDSVLLGEVVARNDVSTVANFFVNMCASKENAIQFLENVIYDLDPTRITRKRPLIDSGLSDGNNQYSKVPKAPGCETEDMFGGDVIADLYDVECSAEGSPITLAIKIPNDMALASYIIGKQGSNVADIRRKTKARTQIEQAQSFPTGAPERHIFFMGSVKAVCEAYQMAYARIVAKADTLPPGTLDELRMVVPTELCAPLIGKAGAVIKRIQQESGARTHVQSEEEMMQVGYYFGRTILINGTERQRCHAMLMLVKQLLSQRDLPEAWRGNTPKPTFAPHGMGRGLGMPVGMGMPGGQRYVPGGGVPQGMPGIYGPGMPQGTPQAPHMMGGHQVLSGVPQAMWSQQPQQQPGLVRGPAGGQQQAPGMAPAPGAGRGYNGMA